MTCHAFEVGTVVAWYRHGLDDREQMPLLSAFLGHAEPEKPTGIPFTGMAIQAKTGSIGRG